MQNTKRYTWQALEQLEFSGQIFEKYSNIKFHENPSSCTYKIKNLLYNNAEY
jgi:hypothetical protein